MKPFIKWVGGKSQLLKKIVPLIPDHETYYEPFIGGGAVFFKLHPKKAIISDCNWELINCYQQIKSNVSSVIDTLATFENTLEFFNEIRALDRDEAYQDIDNITKAARFLYLNKTCHSGLYRTNKQNQFNVPFGRYKNPNFVNADGLHAASRYLKSANVEIKHCDYTHTLKTVTKNDFVYIDPPYIGTFVKYGSAFSEADQIQLKLLVDELTLREVRVLLSNAHHPRVMEIYQGYDLISVQVNRAINIKSTNRKNYSEYLIKNY